MPSTTITYTTSEGSRIAAAVGDRLRLGRSATVAECKQFLADYLKIVVLAYERNISTAAITDTPFDPT